MAAGTARRTGRAMMRATFIPSRTTMHDSLMSRSSRLAFALAVPLAGCGDHGATQDAGVADAAMPADLAPPPMVCHTPVAPGGAWFTDVTAEMGLTPTKSFPLVANTVRAGDLDGDGYAD